MDDHPSPLLAGSPTLRRQSGILSPSDVSSGVSPLGTPPVGFQSDPFTRPAPSRTASDGDRLSKLFPAKRTSIARPPSVSGERISASPRTHYSLPGTSLPSTPPAPYNIPHAPSPPTYTIPHPPAPPAFTENTAYDRSIDPFDVQHAPITQKASRTRSVLDRLGSLRSGNIFRQTKYSNLDDNDGDLGAGRRKLQGLAEEDEEHGVGYDISGFGGPIALQNMNQGRSGDYDSERDLAHAAHAAEFERLEAADRALGDGMTSVIEAAYPDAPAAQQPKRGRTIMLPRGRTILHKRGVSDPNVEAQKVAEETGAILAVPEPPAFDMSSYGGGNIGAQDPLRTYSEGGDSEPKNSYYFPEDKEQPNWRPVSMRWAYILMLVIGAAGLAAAQEWLCQISIKKAKEGKGLLEFQEAAELSVGAYFTWKYLPTIVLVSYGILWQITDYEIKRLEPYYQMSRRSGATADASLNADYVSLISYFVPFQAVRHQHWAVVVSSLSYLLAGSVVPVLQSASVNMYPDKDHRKPGEFKYVRIDTAWSRAVTGVLGLTAILGICLLFLVRRKSGLLSDPKGIAGIAAMATRSHILNDFRGLDTAPQHIINKQLRHRRYILHKSSLWQGAYIRNSPAQLKEHNHDSRPIMLTKRAGYPFLAALLVVAALIPVFLFIPAANTVTEKIPFLLTAIATIVKLVWGSLDMSLRLIEPWYLLAQRHAAPAILTLDYTGTIPGWLSLRALLNGHYLVSAVGLGAILTEVLTVCASSFSVDGRQFVAPSAAAGDDSSSHHDNASETLRSFWISFALAGLILLYLLVVLALALRLRSRKFLPRAPGPIASTLAYIHGSRMLDTFIGAERFDSREMAKKLAEVGGSYGFGWLAGREGEDHCGVEREELLAGYEWGKDWTKSRLVGGNVGSWEHF